MRSTDTAIVTYGRGWPALTCARSLGRRGVRVVCGDSVGFTPSSFSRYCAASFRYPDPREDPDGFLDVLEARVREERAATTGEVVLLPVHSETFLLARHRARFEALGARMALPRSEDIDLTHDKGRLAELAESLDVPLPDTRRYTSLEEVYRDAPGLSYPVFVKLRAAAAGVGVVKVEGPEELVRVYREMVEGHELAPADYPLVQGFVPGHDYCVSVLFDRGRCVAAFTYRNLRQFPRTTGAGVLREAVRAPEAEALARRLLEPLGWHGLAQLDFRWEEGGTPRLIELNPRFFGGLPQAVASGVDYPWLVFQLAQGLEVEPPTVDYSVRTEAPLLGLVATLGELRREEELTHGLAEVRAHLRAQPGGEGAWGRLMALLGSLGRAVHPVRLVRHLRQTLALHRGTVDDVLCRDDPLPVLGALYPVSILIEHGTLSTAVVLSEARAKGAAVVRRGFREHLRPSWRTLLATAAVFLVAVLATSWSVTSSTLVGALFDLPARVGAAVFPQGTEAGLGYAAFHVANFVFLYVLAAFGLKLRDEVRAARAERTAAT